MRADIPKAQEKEYCGPYVIVALVSRTCGWIEQARTFAKRLGVGNPLLRQASGTTTIFSES